MKTVFQACKIILCIIVAIGIFICSCGDANTTNNFLNKYAK